MSGPKSDLQLEVEEFLYREALLLEESRYRDWLALLTDDIRYTLPVRRTVQPNSPAPNSGREEGFSFFDEDKEGLVMRVQRLETGVAYAEVPPSVTQRLITNVLIEPELRDTTLVVHSRFVVHQVRTGRHAFTFYGKRRDRLRREGSELRLAERRIDLADTVLPSTISIFF